jgi:hypothetical protein
MDLGDFVNGEKQHAGVVGLLGDQKKQAKEEEALRRQIAGIIYPYETSSSAELLASIDPRDPQLMKDVGNVVENVIGPLARKHYLANQNTWLAAIPDEKLARSSLEIEPQKINDPVHDAHYDVHEDARNIRAALDPKNPKYAENVGKYAELYIKSNLDNPAKRAEDEAIKKATELKNGSEFYSELTPEMIRILGNVAHDHAMRRGFVKLEQEGTRKDPEKAAHAYLEQKVKEFEESFPRDTRARDIANYTRQNVCTVASTGDKGVDMARKYVVALS